MVRIVGEHHRGNAHRAGRACERIPQVQPDRLPLGDDLRLRPFGAQRLAVRRDHQPRREQLDDRGRTGRDHAGIEQPLGRIDVQLVGDVEDVGDQRPFDRAALKVQIQIAERDRVREGRRWNGNRGQEDHERTTQNTRNAQRRTVFQRVLRLLR